MKLHAQFTVTPCTTRIIEEDDGSMGSMSFYDVNDLTAVSL